MSATCAAAPVTPIGDRAAVRTCILVNPRSFRLSTTSRPERIEQVAGTAGVPIHVVHGPEDMSDVLSADYLAGLDRLIVIGGDGTLQALVSLLAEAGLERIPELLILGGGRTNFTARDLKTHARMDRWLERALAKPRSLRVSTRRLLVLEQVGQTAPVYGFFVAGALVDHVIRDCHRYRARHRDWLRAGHPSSAWRLIQLAALGLIGRSAFQPPRVAVEAGQLGALDQPLRIFIATSLQHAGGWLNPYADRGEGDVRVTAVSRSARRFWLQLPNLLRGRFGTSLDLAGGYLSGRTARLGLHGLGPVCVDGQEYQFDPDRPLTLRAGPGIPFLTP